jgi:hypothetical protein
MNADDERTGRLLRLIRQRSGITQVALAKRARVPLGAVRLTEAGRAGEVRVDRVRSICEAVNGRARLVVTWHGAEADRLLDERHAALVERVVRLLRYRGWDVFVEFSFAEFGERGSIDVLGVDSRTRAVAICEIKSVFGSLESTNRSLDVKVRLAPTIVFKKFGWRPRIVGRLLIVPRDATILRTIERHSSTMLALYPGRGREVRAWLRDPSQPLSAIWFVSLGSTTTAVCR